MASADVKLTVSVEATVARALRSFLEEVHAKHGVRITAVRPTWIAMSAAVHPRHELGMVEICVAADSSTPT